MIEVGVIGAAGRMGREVCKAVAAAADTRLVLAFDRSHTAESVGALIGVEDLGLAVVSDLERALGDEKLDVVVELTHPDTAATHALAALDHGVAVVIGTSGVKESDIETLSRRSGESGTPVLIVPNFALGAVLMMKFCQMAAAYMPAAEIVEMHHNKKADAPSGTAMRTAELIAGARTSPPASDATQVVKSDGARGGEVAGVRIHSMRLPGLLAHQQVTFGAPGELLTIRHDSMDRTSFMAGVLLAVRRVRDLRGLHVGLESVMD
jgi:4-hydroxy-tetrahydrodipicolinate reductase